MSEALQILLYIIEIFIGLVTIGGILWGGFIGIIKPIRKVIRQTEDNHLQNKDILTLLNKKVVPFIDSMTHEFSPNSGKSIKDQITRIDDITRLAELRSKSIASNLQTTGVYECDAQGNCTWANNALCEMFGLTPAEMMGTGWLLGIKASERKRVSDEWMDSVKEDIPYETTYTAVNHKNKEEIYVRTSAVTHKSMNGKILGFYGTVTRV